MLDFPETNVIRLISFRNGTTKKAIDHRQRQIDPLFHCVDPLTNGRILFGTKIVLSIALLALILLRKKLRLFGLPRHVCFAQTLMNPAIGSLAFSRPIDFH